MKMSRDTENSVLLLVGLSIGIICVSGAYSRYVQPFLLPWLWAAAALIVLLAVVAVVRDIRTGEIAPEAGDHHHHHGTTVLWLLLVPIVVLVVIAPPEIKPRAAAAETPAVKKVSANVLDLAFPPLPTGYAPEMSLPDILDRAAHDTTGSLDNRVITVVGFTLKEADRVDLGRVFIICCSADARLARIHLGGPDYPAAADLPDESWVSVEGTVVPGPDPRPRSSRTPMLEIVKLTRIDPPANRYAR